jgi:hypothetical protein
MLPYRCKTKVTRDVTIVSVLAAHEHQNSSVRASILSTRHPAAPHRAIQHEHMAVIPTGASIAAAKCAPHSRCQMTAEHGGNRRCVVRARETALPSVSMCDMLVV